MTAGNAHDRVSFWELYKRRKEREGSRYYVMDAGYKIPAIMRGLIKDGKMPVMPYKSDPEKCKNCPYLKQCTESKNNVKVVTRHIWECYIEQAEDIRQTIGIKEIYHQRKETIERVFADAKEKHGMRYTQYRGLAKVKMERNLLFVYSLSLTIVVRFFIDFPTYMSYNILRHICRKVGLLMNKRGQETRKQIKKCACSLFAEKGFKQVTMKDICDVTELSRGGLYCHYESTRQIFQEIIDDMTSEQDNEMDLKIEQNCSAVTILDEILNKYENEMLDSQSSLSIAIYEYFSIRDIENQSNMLYEQYIISANTWKKLIQYGMDRHEFNEVDISAVFDLIVFSYQGVRMYSKLMPMDKETPSRIIKEIRKILVKRGSDTIPCDSCNKAV